MDMLKAILRNLWAYDREPLGWGALYLAGGIGGLSTVATGLHQAAAGNIELTETIRVMLGLSLVGIGAGLGTIGKAILRSHNDAQFELLPREEQNKRLSRAMEVPVYEVERIRQKIERGKPWPHGPSPRTHDGTSKASGEDEDHGR